MDVHAKVNVPESASHAGSGAAIFLFQFAAIISDRINEGPNVTGPKWNPETAAQAKQIETTLERRTSRSSLINFKKINTQIASNRVPVNKLLYLVIYLFHVK